MKENIRQANSLDPGDVAAFDCSHYVRLSGRQWLIVAAAALALIGLAPRIWDRIDGFNPGDDYRVPYELSNDYWLYHRCCHRECEPGKIPVVGDSVVWGHYVEPNQTLSHYLNELAGDSRFVNLGADGTHPAALLGLLKHYAGDLRGRTVLLHLNPLWMSSAKHDLQTTKEFRFNHPELVPQFSPKIPCYKAPLSARIRIAIRRELPFASWVSHMRAAYFENMDPAAWTLARPYDCPVMAMTRKLPEPRAPQRPPQIQKEPRKQDMAWVDLEGSLQWQFFRKAIRLLQERGNHVFVLVGPFNEHMLTDQNKLVYNKLKDGIEAWMQENRVPYLLPSVLPPECYVDASHPPAEGYALLARTLMESPSFKNLMPERE
ncbi:MAG: hypothetical protein JW955_25535 [Sedimentisphaerales bacterium]|nr:hypothetical protein [Sedimentisphaerales bacterium]